MLPRLMFYNTARQASAETGPARNSRGREPVKSRTVDAGRRRYRSGRAHKTSPAAACRPSHRFSASGPRTRPEGFALVATRGLAVCASTRATISSGETRTPTVGADPPSRPNIGLSVDKINVNGPGQNASARRIAAGGHAIPHSGSASSPGRKIENGFWDRPLSRRIRSIATVLVASADSAYCVSVGSTAKRPLWRCRFRLRTAEDAGARRSIGMTPREFIAPGVASSVPSACGRPTPTHTPSPGAAPRDPRPAHSR